MKQQLNEIKRMQQLAGVIKENLKPDFNEDVNKIEEDTSNVKYIVVDKQEGFSFLADGLDELIDAIGFGEYNTLDQIIKGDEGAYQIIEVKGEIKYILD